MTFYACGGGIALYHNQHVKQATRYRGDNQPSLLDLILTNEEEMIDHVVHNAPLGNSDHEILEFNFKLGRNENTRRCKVFWAYVCVVVLPVYFFIIEITYIQH
jgi:hypothetical protein